MSNLSLTEDQKQKLVELAQNSPELIIHRARLILAYADGKPTIEAAMFAGMSRGRARYWKRQFIARGMDIFASDSEVDSSTEVESQPSDALEKSDTDEIISELAAEERLTFPEEIPFIKPRKSIGIMPDDSLAGAGRKVWSYHFAIMLSHEQGTLLGEDIEELHDMRVATRRMRSAFDIFSPAFNPKIINRYLKGLRKVGRALGQVRDMDVLLLNAMSFQKKMPEQARPGLEALLNDWRHLIGKKRIQLVEHLESESYLRFKQQFNAFLQATEKVTNPNGVTNSSSNRIRDVVPVLVYSRYAAVRAYEAIIPTASVSQLHALRIEFKKFRYTLEYFREILTDPVGDEINEIKQYQDHLGDLHDADVACLLVSNFLKGWEENQSQFPIQARVNTEPIVSYLAYLHRERYQLMVSFPEMWQNFCRPDFRQGLSRVISGL
jgi:CHAD domain-containing protein